MPLCSLSDVEAGGDRPAAQIPLLSSTSINMEVEDELEVPRCETRPRSTSTVSRVTLPESTTGTLSFHRINYVIGGENASKQRKQILSNVSGQFTSGMNAILGKVLQSSIRRI